MMSEEDRVIDYAAKSTGETGGGAMTRMEVATLACRILALWAFVQMAFMGSGFLLMLGMAIYNAFNRRWSRWDELVAAAVTGVPALGALIVGLVLWFGARRVAARMVSADAEPVERASMTHDDLMAIAFAAIGIYLLVPNLQDLAAHTISLVRGDYTWAEAWASGRWHANVWSTMIGLAFALWLILGPRGIVRVVLWARSAAARRDRESVSEP